MEKLKRYIRDHEGLMNILACIYWLIGRNHVKGRNGLILSRGGAFARRLKLINLGDDNNIEIGKGCRIYDSQIRFFGNGNTVIIENDCVLRNVDIWISDGGIIEIGHNTHFTGNLHIACIEGKKVHIGERCLFSNMITFRTGDSHSVLDMEGNRINGAADITVGNHVWVGQSVIVLKGAVIGDEAIIGSGAVVTGKTFPDNVVVAGNPAKVVKAGVMWDPHLR